MRSFNSYHWIHEREYCEELFKKCELSILIIGFRLAEKTGKSKADIILSILIIGFLYRSFFDNREVLETLVSFQFLSLDSKTCNIGDVLEKVANDFQFLSLDSWRSPVPKRVGERGEAFNSYHWIHV